MHLKYFFISLLVVACSSKPPKDPGANSQAGTGKAGESKTVSIESKQLASEEESNLITEISFAKEKAAVSKQAQEELKTLATKAKAKGEIDTVKVITWADMEYPSVHEKELSDKEKNLVKKRNDNIEKYLNQIAPKTKVETISMAERPGALAEMFSTDDASVKKSLETAGIPNTDTSVKVPGKASKSVVIFIMDDK